MKAGPNKAAKEDQSCDESFTPHLPNHVLMEIFCKLPINTLMAVKCVCKSWLNLVSADTHFAELHRQRSPTELLLRSSIDSDGRFGKLSLLFQNSSVSGSKLSLLFHIPRFSFRRNNTIDWNCKNREPPVFPFVNSCNGLLCFGNATFYYKSHCALICNPVTGEFITVPGVELDRCGIYWLGFSTKENRYKLLLITRRSEKDRVTKSSLTKVFAEICTFEKGSLWRNLEDCPFRAGEVLCDPPFLFFEGKLYIHDPFCMTEYMYFFDFDNEQFGTVPLPPLSNEYISTRNAIGVLGGCLSVSLFGSGDCIEIWVMKEYGVRDSWTKAYTMVNKDVSERWSPLCSYPLMYLGKDEVLLSRADNTLLVCNPVLDTSRVLAIGYQFVQVISCTETLLRLKDALAGYEAEVWNANWKVKGDE